MVISMITFVTDAFGGRGSAGPQILMTDDSASERNALHSVWPDATRLLCVFHVLQATWRWLFSHKNGIRQQVNAHLLFNAMVTYGSHVRPEMRCRGRRRHFLQDFGDAKTFC